MSPTKDWIVSVSIYSVLLNVVSSKSSESSLTTVVNAGEESCFFYPGIKKGQTIEFDFQVIDNNSPTGHNDITARVMAPPPMNKELFVADEENEGNFNEELEEDGEYQICLDNTISSWTDKTVWFEVSITDPTDDYYDYGLDSGEYEAMRERNEDTETLFEMKAEEVKDLVHKVRTNVGKIRHFQYMTSAAMSQDSNHVEYNKHTIDMWSVVHVTIMLLVGVIQVVMVKQLFEDKSFFHKFSRGTSL